MTSFLPPPSSTSDSHLNKKTNSETALDLSTFDVSMLHALHGSGWW